MNLLIDTNVLIELIKNPKDEKLQVFMNENIFICGVVKMEMLHGALSQKQAVILRQKLNSMDCLEFTEDDWTDLGYLLYEFRTNGVTVPMQDAMIAYLALKNAVAVWTNDKHFQLMKVIKPELELFSI